MSVIDGASVVFEIPVAETHFNTTVFCSGTALATVKEKTLHVVLFVEQPTVNGQMERVAILRIVMDAAGWEQTIQAVERVIREGAPPKE